MVKFVRTTVDDIPELQSWITPILGTHTKTQPSGGYAAVI